MTPHQKIERAIGLIASFRERNRGRGLVGFDLAVAELDLESALAEMKSTDPSPSTRWTIIAPEATRP